MHLGQFAGVAAIVFGLVFLYAALDTPHGGPRGLSQIGLVAVVAALALYGALQAVDGVAVKHAVDAWAASSGAEKAGRFQAAEAIRWLEWGTRSYHSFMIGLGFIFYGASIAWSGRVAKPIGYLMAGSGLAYLAQGWIIGSVGFSPLNVVPTLAGIVLVIVWSVWLTVAAFRKGRDRTPGTERRH